MRRVARIIDLIMIAAVVFILAQEMGGRLIPVETTDARPGSASPAEDVQPALP